MIEITKPKYHAPARVVRTQGKAPINDQRRQLFRPAIFRLTTARAAKYAKTKPPINTKDHTNPAKSVGPSPIAKAQLGEKQSPKQIKNVHLPWEVFMDDFCDIQTRHSRLAKVQGVKVRFCQYLGSGQRDCVVFLFLLFYNVSLVLYRSRFCSL